MQSSDRLTDSLRHSDARPAAMPMPAACAKTRCRSLERSKELLRRESRWVAGPKGRPSSPDLPPDLIFGRIWSSATPPWRVPSSTGPLAGTYHR